MGNPLGLRVRDLPTPVSVPRRHTVYRHDPSTLIGAACYFCGAPVASDHALWYSHCFPGEFAHTQRYAAVCLGALCRVKARQHMEAPAWQLLSHYSAHRVLCVGPVLLHPPTPADDGSGRIYPARMRCQCGFTWDPAITYHAYERGL